MVAAVSYELGNASRAETIGSIARINGLAVRYRARLVIQRAQGVFETMPRSPAFLD